LYVEVGTTPDELASIDIQSGLMPRVILSLERLGWLKSTDIGCVVHHTMHCAYVHFTPEREEVVPQIMERLHDAGVYPIGRYGLWDYTSMEDSIVSGMETAQALAS
jgi:protoporphyrinogen oxidase